MNIIISNAYCYLNKGDAGIIRAMVQEFRKEYPNSSIKVISLYKDLDIGKYGDCQVIDCLITPYTGTNRVFKIIRNVMLFLLISFLNLLRIPYNETVREIQKADVIVSCGGGYLKARSMGQFLGDFMYHFIQFSTCIQFNKTFVIYAQTIGEFGNVFVKKIIKYVLKRADLVLPRESISYNYTKEMLGNYNNYFATSDIAFLLESKQVELPFLDTSKLKVGITLRSWHFPGESNRYELLENYKNAVEESIKFLSKEYNVEIYLMPQVIGPGKDNDLLITKEIFLKVKDLSNVHLVDIDLTPEELKYVYSKMSLFIGTRMHSNIFSLSERVPCVAISYDLKTDGIMNDVGLGDYVLNIKNINKEELNYKIKKAMSSLDEMKEILKYSIPKITEKSNQNNLMLFQLMRKLNKDTTVANKKISLEG